MAIEPPYQSEGDQPGEDDGESDSINVVLQQVEESEDESGDLHYRKTNVRDTVAIKIDFGDFQATNRIRIWLMMYLAYNSNLVTITDGLNGDLNISISNNSYEIGDTDILSAETLFSGIGVSPAVSKHNVPGDMQISMLGSITEHINPYWDIDLLTKKISELSEKLVYVWSISDDAIRSAAIKRNKEITQQLKELKAELIRKQEEAKARADKSSGNTSTTYGGGGSSGSSGYTSSWTGRVYSYSGSNTTIPTKNAPDASTTNTSSDRGKTWGGGWQGPGFPAKSR